MSAMKVRTPPVRIANRRMRMLRYFGLGMKNARVGGGIITDYTRPTYTAAQKVVWLPGPGLSVINFDCSNFPAVNIAEYIGVNFWFQLSKVGSADTILPGCAFRQRSVLIRGSSALMYNVLDSEEEITTTERLMKLSGFSWSTVPAPGVDAVMQIHDISLEIVNPHDEVRLHAAFAELVPRI